VNIVDTENHKVDVRFPCLPENVSAVALAPFPRDLPVEESKLGVCAEIPRSLHHPQQTCGIPATIVFALSDWCDRVELLQGQAQSSAIQAGDLSNLHILKQTTMKRPNGSG